MTALAVALRADTDLRTVEKAALPDCERALRSMRSGKATELVTRLAPRLARAMAAAELMGRRAELTEPLSLDQYSVVSRKLADAGLDLELDKLQRGYAARAYQVLGSLGSKVDGAVRAAIAKARAAGLKPNKAVSTVSKALDKLGLTVTDSQLETLFRTELAVAFSHGQWSEWKKRWADIWGFRYVTVGDDRVRPTHAAMDGVTLPKDSDIWDTWVPPNGWNCRCRLVPIYKTPGVKPKAIRPDGRPQPDNGFAKNFGGGAALALAWDESKHPRDPGGEGGGQFVAKEQAADISLPPDNSKYQYFYHAVRYEGDIDEILKYGLKPQSGRGRSSDKVYLSKDEVRDRGAGFLIVRVPRGVANESLDVVEGKLKFRQWDVPSIPPNDIVRAVRMVTDSTGFKIREDELAQHAIREPKSPDAKSLPAKYKNWFNLSLDSTSQARVPKGHTGGGRWTKEVWPTSTADLKEVKSLGGSTGAKLVEDANGKRYVLKYGASEEHARNEWEANQLYELLGVPVPKSKMVGKALLTEYIEGTPLNQLTGQELKDAEAQARANFAADALLGNWDVVGLSRDNMLLGKDGKLYRVDNGGSLKFRAKGALKGGKWDSAVSELKSMRQTGEAGTLFGSLTDEDVKKQVNGLVVSGKANLIAKASNDPVLKARVNQITKMSEGTTLWPWGDKGATTPKTYWQMSHKEKVEELGSLAAGAGMTNHQLHQAALMNVDENDTKAYVSWYWDDEQKKAIASAFPQKTPKVVEASKYIKKKYGLTTKELAKKLEDPNFGKASIKTPTTPATPTVKPKVLPKTYPIYEPPPLPNAAKPFGTLSNVSGQKLLTGDSLKNNWAEIKDAAKETESKLTAAQADAIGSWTSSAHAIRAAVIKPDQAHPKHIQLAKDFEAGLEQCEKYSGTTFRGIKHAGIGTEFYSALTTEGSTVEFLAPACSSRSANVGYGFSGNKCLLRIQGNTGAAIENIGWHSSEKEVVIKRGSVFKVVGYAHNVKIQGAYNPVEHVFDLVQVHDEESKTKAKKLALSLSQNEDRFGESDPDSFLDIRFPLSAIIGDDED